MAMLGRVAGINARGAYPTTIHLSRQLSTGRILILRFSFKFLRSKRERKNSNKPVEIVDNSLVLTYGIVAGRGGCSALWITRGFFVDSLCITLSVEASGKFPTNSPQVFYRVVHNFGAVIHNEKLPPTPSSQREFVDFDHSRRWYFDPVLGRGLRQAK